MDMSLLGTSVIAALCGAAYLGVAILAVAQVLRSGLDPLRKGVWTIAVVVAPFLGSMAWFLVGRPGARV
ncbi:hypothetical protein C5C53_16390 [Rathayibacter sp. AY1E3]|uniref:PLD nuclease N-terminal domain-containing protein n=1 Tax=Rathayibacter sp. AY1E3 TaxID=2080551 RepID=UPI000CE8BF2F|nr:PLD nuclease N-terminal domain-containing protein [Rathayibacter sp. AY1E3]PPH33386.1 hypothetical protein C5C53_16390 [Rathayibacter sp. AY1E3]